MDWFEVDLDIPHPMKDPVINQLFELGAEGVTEVSENAATGISNVRAFFALGCKEQVDLGLRPYLDSVSEMYPDLPTVDARVLPLANENWADTYKAFYKPQRLTRLFYLKPAWDTDGEVPDGMVPIVMDPGQAFGTGLHQSTRLCMSLIQSAVELHAKASDIRVIDVGTGTGILAIVAAKLGVKDITAVDNDPLAVEAALDNIVLNQTPTVQVSETPLGDFTRPFQIIISNILLETHKELLLEYKRLLVPGGQLIVSGLLGNQKAELDELFAQHELFPETFESLQEWVAITYSSRTAGV